MFNIEKFFGSFITFILSINLFFMTISSEELLAHEPKSAQSRVQINECWFEKKHYWPDIECGVLVVPQSYEDNNSDKKQLISIPFLRVRPKEAIKGSIPLVIAGGGGPGNGLNISAEDSEFFGSWVWNDYYFSSIDYGRELILIDNRGVGGSKPLLDCEEVEIAEIDSLRRGLKGESYVQTIKDAYALCKRRLESLGVSLNEYNVINAAKDLEELRSALDLTSFHIYGVSYGSRVALMYEQLFPDKTASLVLDGVYPLFVSAYEFEAKNNLKMIDRVFEYCLLDSECTGTFGKHLKEKFYNYAYSLNKRPKSLTVTHPELLKPIGVDITPAIFFSAVFNALYDDRVVSSLPAVLTAIFNGGDDILASFITKNYIKPKTVSSLDEGAYASYTCFDEYPFTDFNKLISSVEKDNLQRWMLEDYLAIEKAMCEVWDVKAAPAELKDKKVVMTPVLLLSGELDPVTPDTWAEELFYLAKTGWLRTWKSIAHDVMSVSECADDLAREFFLSPLESPFSLPCLLQDEKLSFDRGL